MEKFRDQNLPAAERARDLRGEGNGALRSEGWMWEAAVR